MSKVRSKGNKTTEVKLRMALVSIGLGGFTLNNKEIFGRPDFYWAQEKLAVFVDGCYWHGCKKHCRLPKTNSEYWKAKIERNKKRDRVVRKELRGQGHQVLRIWEHELKHNLEVCVEKIMVKLYGAEV